MTRTTALLTALCLLTALAPTTTATDLSLEDPTTSTSSMDTRFEWPVDCRSEWEDEGDEDSYTFTQKVTCTLEKTW